MSKQSGKEATTPFQRPFACTPSSSAVYSHYQQSPFTMSQSAFMQSGSPPYYGHPGPPPIPPWAAKMMSDMSELKKKFETIDVTNKK